MAASIGLKCGRFPLNRLYLEYTNMCNMNCAFCPYSYQTRAKGKLDFDLLRKIVDEVAEYRISNQIEVTGYGEPLIHPDWYEISKYIIDKKIRLNITTNGSLLTESTSERLLELDLDDIIISLQTPDEESFKLRKAKIQYQTYIARIAQLIQKHSRAHLPSRIRLRFLNTVGTNLMSFPEKVSVLDSRKQLISSLKQWIETVYRITDRPYDETTVNKKLHGIARFQPTMIHITENITFESYFCHNYWIYGTENRVRFPTKTARCRALTLESALIYHNGDVSLCCSDYDNFLNIGCLANETLMEVFESRRANFLIDGFRRFRVRHPYCQNCLGSVIWCIYSVNNR